MLREIFNNRKQILEGIKNNIFKKEHVEQIADIRLNICKMCEHYDDDGTGCLVPGTQPCCGECGCSLALKTRSLSSACPVSKWDAMLTDEEEDKLKL